MSGFAIAPTGAQTMTQREVDQFLADARNAPKTKNPRVLGINLAKMMQAKNNGYPKHMYHERLDTVIVTKEEEEAAAKTLGYSESYIPRAYPKVLHRRNMDPKFQPKFDSASGNLMEQPYIESRTIRNEKEEQMLLRMAPKKGQSPWLDSAADVDAKYPIEEGPSEDPAVTIARLTGEISGLKRQIEDAEESDTPRRGRRKQAEPAEA